MKSKYIKSSTAAFLLLLFTAAGCKKFLDPGRPQTEIETSNVFLNDETAFAAVAGLYDNMEGPFSLASGAASLCAGLSADELTTTTPRANLDPFTTNSLLPNTSMIFSAFWNPVYNHIYQINATLNGLENANLKTPGLKSQLQGQLLITRAFLYFYLNQYFGNAPLLTTTDYEANALKPNSTGGEIRAQVIKDLADAETLIGDQYSSTMHSYPEKLTATALLARAYLYNVQWKQAEDKATEVINSGKFILEQDLNTVFENTSGETIWQIGKDNNNTTLAPRLLPSGPGALPQIALTNGLLQAFEPNDQRHAAWVGISTVNGQDYSYSYKYKNRKTSPVTEYFIVMRLAELYLIRAEARARQDNLSGSLEDINIIRQRAELDAISLSDKEAILAAIAHERQTELFTEGHRWLDLKRTKQADAVLSVIKGANWQPTDTLYPFPQSDITTNPNLRQNPGY